MDWFLIKPIVLVARSWLEMIFINRSLNCVWWIMSAIDIRLLYEFELLRIFCEVDCCYFKNKYR